MVIVQKEQWNQVHNHLQRRLDAYLLKFSFFVLYNLLEICTWCKLLDVWRGWRLDVVIHQSKGKFIRSNFNIKIEGPLCTKINWQKASRPSSCLRSIPGNWFCHIHSNSPNLLLIFQLNILILMYRKQGALFNQQANWGRDAELSQDQIIRQKLPPWFKLDFGFG